MSKSEIRNPNPEGNPKLEQKAENGAIFPFRYPDFFRISVFVIRISAEDDFRKQVWLRLEQFGDGGEPFGLGGELANLVETVFQIRRVVQRFVNFVEIGPATNADGLVLANTQLHPNA